jgi:Ca2+/H+ antiporter, TMEM165/GDT1 family
VVWSHAVSAGLPAFLASVVEFVEALTIVLAVGVTRGWRSALLGALAGAVLLAVLVLAFGPALALVPIAILQLVVGTLLLLFGLRWLHKAVLRTSGVVALHDEAGIYERHLAQLAASGEPQPFDFAGFITAFKSVVLEGLEIVFIVIAVGATAGALIPATIGAALAGVVVIGAGVAVKAPLSRVPENTLKFVVGVLLSSFGTFWTGEALGVPWLGDDLSLVLLAVAYVAVALVAVAVSRATHTAAKAAP